MLTKRSLLLSSLLVLMLSSVPVKSLALTEGDYTYEVVSGEARITGLKASYPSILVISNTLGGFPVTSIGEWAFAGCAGLTSVTIPASITTIGYSAFINCSGLSQVIIPDSVTTIGGYAFSECVGLKRVTLPPNITCIPIGTFNGCTGLMNVDIPSGVTTLGYGVFAGCTGLRRVTIPDSVTSIEGCTFSGCTKLIQVAIPRRITYIPDNMFTECNSLTHITIPTNITSIGVCAFTCCFKLDQITIPNSVTTIKDGAFSGCVGLTRVTIPNSVTTLDGATFMECFGLTAVTLPDNITTIPPNMFTDCTSLTHFTIPTNITSIGIWAFARCTSLAQIDIPSSVTTIDAGAFFECTSLTNITLPDSVTSLGYEMFYGCTGLTSITLSTNITALSANMFAKCTALTRFAIPDHITSIGIWAFKGCTSLAHLDIPDSVNFLGEEAFQDCTGLTSVIIPASVNSIEYGVFSGCARLKGLYFKGNSPVNFSGVWGLDNAEGDVFCYYVAGSTGWGATYGECRTLLWTRDTTFHAMGGAASFSGRTYNVGHVYGELPAAERPGYTFNGWWTLPQGFGEQVTLATRVPYINTGHMFYASWIPNPCGDESQRDVPWRTSGQYTGYLLGSMPFGDTEASSIRGVFSLSVSMNGGSVWLTAKAVTQNGSLSFSARGWDATDADGTKQAAITLPTGETLVLRVRQNRIWGMLSGGSLGSEILALDGSRNRFVDVQDAGAQTILETYKGYYTVALPPYDAIPTGAAQTAPEGSGYLTLTVGNAGSVRIAGKLADDTSFSHASTLMLFDGCGPEACVPLFVPLYSRKGWTGGLLWFTPGGKAVVTTDRDLGWFVRWEKPAEKADGASVLLDAVGGYYGTTAALADHYLFSVDTNAVPHAYTGGAADLLITALPDGIGVTRSGSQLTMTRGTFPVLVGGVYDYSAENSARATLSFTSKTGIFKGSFSLYYDDMIHGFLQHYIRRVSYAGVLTPVRGHIFTDEPAGQGYYLLPDKDPLWAGSSLKRSYRIMLEEDTH